MSLEKEYIIYLIMTGWKHHSWFHSYSSFIHSTFDRLNVYTSKMRC